MVKPKDEYQGINLRMLSPSAIYPGFDLQSTEPSIEFGKETKDTRYIHVRGTIVRWNTINHYIRKRNFITGRIEMEQMERPTSTLRLEIETGLGCLPLNLRVGDDLLEKFLDGKRLKIEFEIDPIKKEQKDDT